MKVLTNRNGSYLTGDEIADAVMQYGLALMRNRDVDIVNIPFVGPDGETQRAEFAIGWQIETSATSHSPPTDGLVEVDTILAIYAKAEALGASHGEAFSDEERAAMQWPMVDLDYLYGPLS